LLTNQIKFVNKPNKTNQRQPNETNQINHILLTNQIKFVNKPNQTNETILPSGVKVHGNYNNVYYGEGMTVTIQARS
jgi:hypothetical protein